MKETPDSAQRPAQPVVATGPLFGVWYPIDSAPKDGTKFLAWIAEDWIELMYYDEMQLFYGSDGDMPPHGRNLPKYWMPRPPSPNAETCHGEDGAKTKTK